MDQEPTVAELAILRVLWEAGPSTVREVHEALGGERGTRYTTTLKQLQVMAEKGLVKRDESQRSHVYTAEVKEEKTERSLVNGFLDRVMNGSVQKMLLHALNTGNVSAGEIREIKQLLKEWEKRK